MGEAAVKEPSMEDILSSIRKIISEEGEADAPVMEELAPEVQPVVAEVASEPASESQMSEVLEEVRASEPEPAPITAPAPSDISGNEAAKMAASLASIAATVKEEVANEPAEHVEPEMVEAAAPEASVWDEVAEPVIVEEPAMEEVAPVEPQAAPSLASIAETVTEQVQVPAVEEVIPAAAPEETVEPVEVMEEPEVRHVEMAEATPAPVAEEVAPATMASTVETMVEEEMAFKGALMSPSADSAVAGSLDRLKRSAMDDIDAKVEAVIRPMLREWLDENLPNMVERLVREEIERVARGV